MKVQGADFESAHTFVVTDCDVTFLHKVRVSFPPTKSSELSQPSRQFVAVTKWI